VIAKPAESSATIELRDLRTVADCRGVVAVQEAVWGQGSEIVPASVLLVSAKRGGILIGAVRDEQIVGFVWSMPGWREGRPTQWSHMLGVLPDVRGDGLGRRLKLAQRERGLAQDIELIEWTFDPLQAPNAHLNFSALGATAGAYLADAYGSMPGPLHRGTATDRLIAEWWIREPHVQRRINPPALVARSRDVLDAPVTIATDREGPWLRAGDVRTDLDAPRVLVPVPAEFTRMQQESLAVAQAWRLATRDVFTSYFARGYRAVDFFRNREQGGGLYLLARAGGAGL
jgi:predicted GNAT superfamily acetyltransferase